MRKARQLLFSLFAAALLVASSAPRQAEASWYIPRPPSQPPSEPGAPQPTPPQQPAPDPAPPAPQPPPSDQPSADLSADERAMLALINDARQKEGLRPLVANVQLTRLARLKARDIIEKGYFGHKSPTYGTPLEMERAAGIKARVMGAENLAKARDYRRAHGQLMASAGHRSNLMLREHTEIGIGILPYKYGVVVCQLFIGN